MTSPGLTPYRALELYSRSQLARGVMLVLLPVGAIYRPEVALPVSMLVAGMLVILSGAYDVIVGVRSRSRLRAAPLLIGHGAACVAFGALTVGLPYVPLPDAMALVALWLLLYGSLMGALALALWPMRRTRWTLVVLMVVVIIAGIGAALLGDLPEFVPLYLGAFFAMFLGVLHLAAGAWIRRVALPRFSPTLQSSWIMS